MGQYYRPIVETTQGRTVFNRDVDGEYTLAKLLEHSYWDNTFCRAFAEKLVDTPTNVCWVGDYAEPEECEKLGFTYDEVWGENAKTVSVKKPYFSLDEGRYLVNQTRGEVVDLREYKRKAILTNPRWGIINPIPLLTCLGNGRGGGDFRKNEKSTNSYVGRWAWDVIYLTNDEPPKDYRKIHPVFVE